MTDFRRLADSVADRIADGELLPGTRLPTQRRFARQNGIAVSTAARAYGELRRRGLIVGEVGRGSFVRAGAALVGPALAEPAAAPTDLEFNFPTLPEQSTLLAGVVERLADPYAFAAASVPVGPTGTAPAREAVAALLARGHWQPAAEHIVFSGSGRQAIAAAIAAIVRPGGRLGVEALSYPVIKATAEQLGVTLVPIATDEDGMTPAGVVAGYRRGALQAVYLQPALHNPLGTTMSAPRREELAAAFRRWRLPVIEDAVYSFLHDHPAFAELLPDTTVVVDSMSKRLAPGLTIGFAAAPTALREAMMRTVRSGGWGPARFALEASVGWIADGTASAIGLRKRADARERQSLVAQRLAEFDVRADPSAYHAWWTLPERWRAETFVAAAARRGIAVTPATAFVMGSGSAPRAVRLALGSPSVADLRTALDALAALAGSDPEAEFAPDGG